MPAPPRPAPTNAPSEAAEGAPAEAALPDPAAVAEDAKWRFLTCAALTVPVLYLSPPVQGLLGLEVAVRLSWTPRLLLGLTAAVCLYGGWPFAAGAWRELRRVRPGRMVLVALAVAGAFAFAAGAIGLDGAPYFWETAALVDAALAGLWIEARGVAGLGPVTLSRSRSHPPSDRAALGLTLAALIGGALALAAWLLLSERGAAFAVGRAVAVMVVACPHALGRAAPLAASFEQLHRLTTVVFGTTGGLTEGRFAVTDVLTPPDRSTDDVLALAAAVGRGSAHPVAAGILRSAQERRLPLPTATDAEAMPGRGVRAVVEGRTVQVLSPSAVREAGVRAPFEAVAPLEAEGLTVVWLVDDGRVAGALALADRVRPESAGAVRALQAMGLEVVLLTGESHPVAAHVAGALGIDRVEAEVRPEERAARLRALQSGDRVVALASDLAGPDDDPHDVARAIRRARASYRTGRQNRGWIAGYHAVALPLAAGALAGTGVVLPPAAGAVLASLAAVVVRVHARRGGGDVSSARGTP